MMQTLMVRSASCIVLVDVVIIFSVVDGESDEEPQSIVAAG